MHFNQYYWVLDVLCSVREIGIHNISSQYIYLIVLFTAATALYWWFENVEQPMLTSFRHHMPCRPRGKFSPGLKQSQPLQNPAQLDHRRRVTFIPLGYISLAPGWTHPGGLGVSKVYRPCRVNVATPLENQANTVLQSSWPQKTGGLEPLGNHRTTAWKSVTLTKLCGGQNKCLSWLFLWRLMLSRN